MSKIFTRATGILKQAVGGLFGVSRLPCEACEAHHFTGAGFTRRDGQAGAAGSPVLRESAPELEEPGLADPI